MYIEKSEFTLWMEKLSEKLDKIGKSLKELCNSSKVMKDDKLLDNQDLAFLLKVSCRTLQRYRTNGVLPSRSNPLPIQVYQCSKLLIYKGINLKHQIVAKSLPEWCKRIY